MNKLMQYIKDVRNEMAKVSWPTLQEVRSATMLVVTLSIIVSLIVKVFDIVLSRTIGFFLNM